ncbi:MAG: peptidoglycan DD-metalloendopeptidase family protein [Saprospiraceae bacterium]|nr:peptidoglycan DD-metalloendopeptidase family protein [Saprospiraceae bacterium]
MRKEKFVYNTHTLQYEKIKESLSTTILRAFMVTCAILFTGILFAVFIFPHFQQTSPEVKAKQAEIDALKEVVADANRDVARYEKSLQNLQERDAYAHRMIFGMDPIDDNVWNGGVGGHEKYVEYKEYKSSGEQIIDLKTNLDRLKRKLVLQSKSLDTITELAKQKEEMFAAIPSIKPVRGDKLARGIYNLSGFGRRIHPILKIPKMHHGIDFTAPTGTPIYASGAGKVIRAEYSRTFGNVVVIEHGYGYKTIYAHMSKMLVKKGDEVIRGHEIGKVGNTGRSTAPHCHYEVHHKNKPVNPINFCLDGLTPKEYMMLIDAANLPNQSFDYKD